MQQPLLIADKISFQYAEGSKGVNNLSFEIRRNEILCICGANGAGKSTLLYLLSGKLLPQAGSLVFSHSKEKFTYNELLKSRNGVWLVPQDYGLKPAMTVQENLRYAMLGYAKNDVERQIKSLSKICKIHSSWLTKKPDELSGGQQQLVALARALATQPKLILLDEPFSNLDHFNRLELTDTIRSISKEMDTAFVMVTHDAADALSLADNILILKAGRKVQIDAPRTVYAHPKNSYVAGLLGDVNVLNSETAEKLRLPLPPYRKVWGIYADNVKISTGKGIPTQIVNSYFKGGVTAYKLDCQGVILHAKETNSSDRKIEIGEHSVVINPENLLLLDY